MSKNIDDLIARCLLGKSETDIFFNKSQEKHQQVKVVFDETLQNLKRQEQEALDIWYKKQLGYEKLLKETVKYLNSLSWKRREISSKLGIGVKRVYQILSYNNGKPASKSIRESVKTRDKNKCKHCGTKKKLVVHHKNGGSHRTSNLVTICNKCHKKVHKELKLQKQKV